MSHSQTHNDPAELSNGETPPRSEVMQLMDRPWVIIVLLLHVGFLGIPIYWKTKYSVGVRLGIIVASIAYTLFAVVFIVLMLRWIARVFETL